MPSTGSEGYWCAWIAPSNESCFFVAVVAVGAVWRLSLEEGKVGEGRAPLGGSWCGSDRTDWWRTLVFLFLQLTVLLPKGLHVQNELFQGLLRLSMLCIVNRLFNTAAIQITNIPCSGLPEKKTLQACMLLLKESDSLLHLKITGNAGNRYQRSLGRHLLCTRCSPGAWSSCWWHLESYKEALMALCHPQAVCWLRAPVSFIALILLVKACFPLVSPHLSTYIHNYVKSKPIIFTQISTSY